MCYATRTVNFFVFSLGHAPQPVLMKRRYILLYHRARLSRRVEFLYKCKTAKFLQKMNYFIILFARKPQKLVASFICAVNIGIFSASRCESYIYIILPRAQSRSNQTFKCLIQYSPSGARERERAFKCLGGGKIDLVCALFDFAETNARCAAADAGGFICVIYSRYYISFSPLTLMRAHSNPHFIIN